MDEKSLKNEYKRKLVEYGIPGHMHKGYINYILYGTPGGSFLQAILTNDFIGAFDCADEKNQAMMKNHANFLYNVAPMAAIGSRENYYRWIAKGGIVGDYKEKNGKFRIRDVDGQEKTIKVENCEVYETDGTGTVEEWKDYFLAMGCSILEGES